MAALSSNLRSILRRALLLYAIAAACLLVYQNWRTIENFDFHDDLKKRAAVDTNFAKYNAHQNGVYTFLYTEGELLEIDIRYYLYASWSIAEPFLKYVVVLGFLAYLALCFVVPTVWRFLVSGKLS